MKQTLRQINTILLISILGLWMGCNSDPVDPVVIVSIEDEFELNLKEKLAVDASSLTLKIQSIATVNCEDTAIDIDYKRNGHDEIVVALNGIIEPVDCIEADVPAEAIVNIGYLPERTFVFDLNLKGETVTNTGKLTVSRESYVLEMETNNGFKLLHETLIKVPYQAIWGVVNFQDLPVAMNAATNLVNDIEAISAAKTYTEGYYGHFRIDDSQKIVTNYPTELPNTQAFIFDYRANIDDLQNLVHQYREEHEAYLEIQLFTWNGQVF